MATAKPGPNALLFIFITVMINMVGFGVILPVMPQLIMDVTGQGLAEASRWGGYISVAYAIMQFIMMPVMGQLSDRYGRRPVLLGSLAAYAADFLMLALAPSIAVIFVARILAGCFAATFSTANAYIADITPPEKRAANFGLMGAAFGLGFIIGPALGGLIGDEYGHRAPFYAVAALGAVNFLYGWFFLPETNPPENRRPFDWRRANALASFRNFRRYPAILPTAAAFLLLGLARWSFPAVWAYYAREAIGWSAREIGFSLMAVGLSAAIVEGGLTRIVIPRLGEARAALLGVSIGLIAYVGYAFASSGWMIYALIAFGAFAGFATPALQGIMSKSAPGNAQGELQGAIGSLNGVAMIAGPLVMTQVFAAFTEERAPFHFPGAHFLLAAFLAATAYVPLLHAVRRLHPGAGRPESEQQAAAASSSASARAG
jgi:DHA1 family tetracycline resistance protein-like MFS transporter